MKKKYLNKNNRLLVTIFLILFISTTPFLFDTKISFAASAESLQRMGYVSPSFNLIKKVQKTLMQKGYAPGPVDGLWGPKTRSAVHFFQKDNGLPVTNYLNKETLKLLFSE